MTGKLCQSTLTMLQRLMGAGPVEPGSGEPLNKMRCQHVTSTGSNSVAASEKRCRFGSVGSVAASETPQSRILERGTLIYKATDGSTGRMVSSSPQSIQNHGPSPAPSRAPAAGPVPRAAPRRLPPRRRRRSGSLAPGQGARPGPRPGVRGRTRLAGSGGSFAPGAERALPVVAGGLRQADALRGRPLPERVAGPPP